MKRRYNDDPHYRPKYSIEDFSHSIQSDLKDFICFLCKGVAIDPVIDNNGDLFCRECLSYYQTTHNFSPVTNKQYPVKFAIGIPTIKQFLLKQMTRCPNRREGCRWEGPLKDNRNHVENECLKIKIICPNEGCGEKIIKENLHRHKEKCIYRKIRCEYCKKEIIVKNRKVHKEICPEMIVECPNNCKEKLKRKNIKEHIEKVCENTNLKCPFNSLGCPIQIQRKNMKQHITESFNNHLLSMAFNFQNTKQECIQIAQKIVDEQKNNPNLLNYLKECIAIKLNVSDFQFKKLFDNILPEQITNHYKHQNIFDLKYINKGITVQGCNAKCVSNNNNRYLYLFTTIDVSPRQGEKCFKWEILLSCKESFFALGLCDKKKVLENNLTFEPNKFNDNHGSFLFSMNGYTWNANNKSENNQRINNFPIKENQHVIMEYIPEFKVLYCRVDNYRGQITDVCPIIDDKLTMCFILTKPGDELEIIG